MIGTSPFAAIRWALDPARRRFTIIALLLALLIGSVLMARHWRHEALEARSAAELSEGLREADNASLTVSRDIREDIRQKEATGLEKTTAALEAHPDWANEPVPDDVLRSLHE